MNIDDVKTANATIDKAIILYNQIKECDKELEAITKDGAEGEFTAIRVYTPYGQNLSEFQHFSKEERKLFLMQYELVLRTARIRLLKELAQIKLNY